MKIRNVSLETIWIFFSMISVLVNYNDPVFNLSVSIFLRSPSRFLTLRGFCLGLTQQNRVGILRQSEDREWSGAAHPELAPHGTFAHRWNLCRAPESNSEKAGIRRRCRSPQPLRDPLRKVTFTLLWRKQRKRPRVAHSLSRNEEKRGGENKLQFLLLSCLSLLSWSWEVVRWAALLQKNTLQLNSETHKTAKTLSQTYHEPAIRWYLYKYTVVLHIWCNRICWHDLMLKK